jgi:glycosyltransferase involved in cell wall biosynthesis
MKESNSKFTLGIVAISRNEERDLPGFLGHLLPWVDEIVIVDDGSTDKTKEIIQRAGNKVKLIEHAMSTSGGFAEQRNIGITACQADWILNMDIDERVTPELAQEILARISSTDLNGFRYRRLNFFFQRPMKAGGWEGWNRAQLARRGNHSYVNRLHERCVIQGEPESVGQLKGVMWHLNDENYKERMAKSFKYSLAEAERVLEKGKNISWITIITRPVFEFIKKYFLKLGMLDGIPGLIAAMHSADAVFRAHALAWDEQNQTSREKLEETIRLMWSQQNVRETQFQRIASQNEE